MARMRWLLPLVLCAALRPVALIAAPAPRWPLIQPVDQRIDIDLSNTPLDIRLPVRTSKGTPLYWLRCVGGSTEQLDVKGDRDGNNYVAPLACVLVEQPDDWHGSLLSEDASAIWYSRGQFHGNDLTGACGRYPEFGVARHFRLRGVALTLAAEQIRAGSQGVTRFVLHVIAKPDPGALTAVAERPEFLPSRDPDCRVVHAGKEPLMCRNEQTFSWQHCSKEQLHAMGYPGSDKP